MQAQGLPGGGMPGMIPGMGLPGMGLPGLGPPGAPPSGPVELYVANLPPGADGPDTKAFLGGVLEEAGVLEAPGNPVTEAHVAQHEVTLAFLLVRTESEAAKAVRKADGVVFRGHKLKIGEDVPARAGMPAGWVPTVCSRHFKKRQIALLDTLVTKSVASPRLWTVPSSVVRRKAGPAAAGRRPRAIPGTRLGRGAASGAPRRSCGRRPAPPRCPGRRRCPGARRPRGGGGGGGGCGCAAQPRATGRERLHRTYVLERTDLSGGAELAAAAGALWAAQAL